MKLIVRIFNVIILALSAVACIFLFNPPAFSFKSKITIDVVAISEFIPSTEFSNDINIEELLGTDSIYCGINFTVDMNGLNDLKDGDKDKINNTLIKPNLDDLLLTLHEPVDLITDLFIRQNIVKLITEQVTNYVDEYAETLKTNNPAIAPSIPDTDELMDEVGMDAEYFSNFAIALYDEANSDTASVDSVTDVLFEQIGEALGRAGSFIDSSAFDESQKESIKTSINDVFGSLGLIKEDGQHINKITHIGYVYLSSFLYDQLKDTVDNAELAQAADEDMSSYCDRLISLFVENKIPDIVYTVLGYVNLGLYIGLFVFAGVWGLLALITLIKTFTKKPWTIFGFWFWIIGAVELVIGFGLTAITKFALSKFDIASLGLPLSGLLVSIKTYALIPSIAFIVCIPLSIVYGFFKRRLKRKIKREGK